MKKLLLTLFSLAFFITTKAQPTLTAANFMPVLGEVTTNKNCAYSAPGPGGASQTWNFSAVTATATATSTMVTPGSIPGSGPFVGSTIASNDGSTNNGFFAVNANTFQVVGYKSNTINIVYSNREDLMRLPLTMSNTYTDYFAATFTTSSAFYRKGNTTVTADGYGTITTPAGTFNNVLRVHLQQIYKDSTYIGVPYQIYYNNDEYIWYAPGTHAAILACYTFSNSVGAPTQQLVYLQSISTGISEASLPASEFSLFPNPTAGQVNFELKNLKGTGAKAVIYNTAGIEAKQITFTGLNNNLSLDVSDLPDGIYFARLNVDGILSESKRFIISK